MVNAAGYSFKCDVWALGITLVRYIRPYDDVWNKNGGVDRSR